MPFSESLSACCLRSLSSGTFTCTCALGYLVAMGVGLARGMISRSLILLTFSTSAARPFVIFVCHRGLLQ